MKERDRHRDRPYDFEAALAGSPNVGKSTIFNHLTGLRQHTGNWAGKTVKNACGYHTHGDRVYKIVDLPGTYSLNSGSPEQIEALNYIRNDPDKCIVIVTSALSLERNLSLAIQILAFTKKALLCVNMMDEADKNGLSVNLNKLSLKLGIPAVACSSKHPDTMSELKDSLYHLCEGALPAIGGLDIPKEYIRNNIGTEECSHMVDHLADDISGYAIKSDRRDVRKRYKIDRILTSKAAGLPIMAALYALLFWITAVGANYPSELLSGFFSWAKGYLTAFLSTINAPSFIVGLAIDGIYTTFSWVIAVMLPPMAIFFPLFSILEDSGYLPRIAFNLDGCFDRQGISSKQCLTMAMGMGCNACGVTGCRIIESRRDRNIAILTNSFIPCNGRLPALFAVGTLFFTRRSGTITDSLITALVMVSVYAAAVVMTLTASGLLAKIADRRTRVRSVKSSDIFILELPPYRKPDVLKIIIRSLSGKALPVLCRAAAVSAPAGAVIWLLNNIKIADGTLISYCVDSLDPIGVLLGVDGVILTAFILGFPANEIVIPVMLMLYLGTGTMTDGASLGELQAILLSHGWSAVTALCFIALCVFHYPCSTACVTIYKESGSARLTALAVLLPTAIGLLLCGVISGVANLVHIFF